MAFAVPDAKRLATLRADGAATVEALPEALTREIVLPDGTSHPRSARPVFASADVDLDTGTVAVRG